MTDGQRILVVDDQQDIRDMTALVLSGAGYRVDTVDSGESALSALEQDRFDLVLLDINMPGIDGWHVLELLLEQDPSLPVVMVSGYVRHDEAIQGGARHMLQKPFGSSLLLAVVEEHIRAA